MSTAPALVATGLTKTYDDLVALHPLDLTVPAGGSVALIGHNGSGKSTFLRMAAGLLDPTGGELEIAWPADDAPLTMAGPAAFVFEGEWIG